MNLILRKAQKEIDGFGVRSLTESDFHRECAKRSIEVVEVKLDACKGLTMWMLGRVIIVISVTLKADERLKVMWHEFAHAWLHAPGVSAGALFCGVNSLLTKKQEREVDDFVSVALVQEEIDI